MQDGDRRDRVGDDDEETVRLAVMRAPEASRPVRVGAGAK